jgi:hypothetical protein
VDLSAVTPVIIRSATLLADKDPYNSLKPTLKPEAAPQPATETAGNQKTENAASETEVKTASNAASLSPSSTQTADAAPEIRKAIPVQPQDKKPVEIRRAIPVKPLDQEDVDQTLMKSAARPSDNLDE